MYKEINLILVQANRIQLLLEEKEVNLVALLDLEVGAITAEEEEEEKRSQVNKKKIKIQIKDLIKEKQEIVQGLIVIIIEEEDMEIEEKQLFIDLE